MKPWIYVSEHTFTMNDTAGNISMFWSATDYVSVHY